MVVRDNLTLRELNRVEVADISGRALAHRQIQHLVEVAIVESSIPADRDGVAAHHAGGGSRIEGVGQSLHILLVIAALHEKLKKPADRHVGDRIEVVERNAVPGQEFFPELRFDGLLLGWEKGACRIVDEIEREPTARLSVAEPIEQPQRLDRLFKNALASLRIGLTGAGGGERGDHLDAMFRQELPQVGL